MTFKVAAAGLLLHWSRNLFRVAEITFGQTLGFLLFIGSNRRNFQNFLSKSSKTHTQKHKKYSTTSKSWLFDSGCFLLFLGLS